MKFLKTKKTEEVSGRNPRDYQGKTAPVFSYYSKRSHEDETTARKVIKDKVLTSRKKAFWLSYLPSLVSLFIVLIAAFYVTTLSPNPRVAIATRPDQPAVLQPSKVYEEKVRDLMKSSILNRSKLTINTDKLASELEDEFPELGKIAVTIPLFGRRPVVQTSPAIPSLIFTVKNGSFVIDNRGIAILKASQLASSIRDTLPVVTDTSDTEVDSGKQIITTGLVDFIEQIHKYLQAKKISTESYILPSLTNELHVRPTGKGYYVKFNTETEAKLQVGTYLAVKERLDAEGKEPSEYIDVRVDERAYIR